MKLVLLDFDVDLSAWQCHQYFWGGSSKSLGGEGEALLGRLGNAWCAIALGPSLGDQLHCIGSAKKTVFGSQWRSGLVASPELLSLIVWCGQTESIF